MAGWAAPCWRSPITEGNGGFSLKEVGFARKDGIRRSERGFDEITSNTATVVVEASDPRLSGAWTEMVNCRKGPSGAQLFLVCVGRVRVENEGGTWLGTVQMSGATFGHGPHFSGWMVLEGQGDYTGLTAISHYAEARMGADDINGEGVIFDFGMPPLPDPIEPRPSEPIASPWLPAEVRDSREPNRPYADTPNARRPWDDGDPQTRGSRESS